MIQNDRGIFIVLEGGEGAGKSTIIKYLEEELENVGIPVTIFREPGGTSFAENIRNLFFKHEDLSAETSTHLMNAQRLDNIEKIITPTLNNNGVIIADRFTASTLVYQGLLNKQYDTVEPIMVDHEALTIFVDVKPEVGLQRIEQNKRDTNYFDEMALEKHQQIYSGFKELEKLKPESYWDLTINGEQSLKELRQYMKKLAHVISYSHNLGMNTNQLKNIFQAEKQKLEVE